jgi:hypothetical protein
VRGLGDGVGSFAHEQRVRVHELRENFRTSAGLGVNLEPASADKDLSAMNVTINVDLTPSEVRELVGFLM